MDTKILENLGLTKNQSLVYLSLLKLGSSSAQNIIKESGLHRSRVYDTLESLQQKGLVSSVIKNFKRHFQSVPPEKLLNFLEEKKQALREELPKLKQLEGMKKEEIKASIYKGKEGLKTIYSEMLKEGKDIKVLGAKAIIVDELEYVIPHFDKERISKGMKWINLWDTKEAKNKAEKFRKKIEGKVLPKGYDGKSVVNIFGNKVSIVLWEEKHPTAFMIENKEIADSFRKWFDLIYEKI